MGKKGKKGKKKVNPLNIPRTQADVDRAWDEGVMVGVSNACAIFLTVLCDKYNGRDHVSDVWSDINKLSEEVAERRVSVGDLKRVLLDEYGLEV